MLLVNARAGVSKIHGFGLIAQEFIPKGKYVWEFRENFDLTFSSLELRNLSQPALEQVL